MSLGSQWTDPATGRFYVHDGTSLKEQARGGDKNTLMRCTSFAQLGALVDGQVAFREDLGEYFYYRAALSGVLGFPVWLSFQERQLTFMKLAASVGGVGGTQHLLNFDDASLPVLLGLTGSPPTSLGYPMRHSVMVTGAEAVMGGTAAHAANIEFRLLDDGATAATLGLAQGARTSVDATMGSQVIAAGSVLGGALFVPQGITADGCHVTFHVRRVAS